MRRQNLTEHKVSAIVLPESDDRFDHELVGWFAPHGSVWSGTAFELLAALKTGVDVGNDLWLQSPGALYAHIESRRQILRSLGVDVLLQHGYPRMISLRSCQDEQLARKLPPSSSGTNRASAPAMNFPPLADDRKTSAVDSAGVRSATNETFIQDMPMAKSDLAERFVSGKYADGENFEGHVFDNTAEALLAIAEMVGQIREQGLDRKSTLDLVVSRTQEITRCSGVAIGLLQHNSLVYPARAGVAATMVGLHFQAILFQCCLTNEALQLGDAQNDPLVGPSCRREGIGSLIILPIFRDREVAGAMELLFKDKRSFSTGDLMTLELIIDVVSEHLSGAAQIGLTQAEGRECPAKPKAVENIEPQFGHSSDEKADRADALPSPFQDTINAETSVGKFAASESSKPSTISRFSTAPTLLWLAMKRAWMKSIRAR